MLKQLEHEMDEKEKKENFGNCDACGKEVIGEAANPYIFQVGSDLKPDQLYLNQEYDYLLDDYRKVLDIRGFEMAWT